MERMHTFIDVDENRLELWLRPDRIQLVVVDSRPELEAGELRRFASAVFTEYVARDLAAQLDAARLRLREASDLASGSGALAAALDGALRALDGAATAIAVPAPEPIVVPDPEPEVEVAEVDAAPAPATPVRELTGLRPYLPLKPSRRGKRACESSTLRWSVGAIEPKAPPR
ncbi:MAG TPA: hypothetical protein VIX73_25180 [Kofleriaceae bacterium]|jgi:hypothetical protein